MALDRDRGHPGVRVGESSIEGLGVFATRDFAAGERIRRVNVVREVTPEAPVREDRGERVEHCGYPDGRVLLWGYPDRHVNHSCDPNAYERYDGDGIFDIAIVARRAIADGEEITFDYLVNNSGGDSWPCHCGSPRCIGETAAEGFFGLPEERQMEYLPLLAAWFVERHRELLDALRRGA